VNRTSPPPTAYNKAHKSCLDNGARNSTPCWICGRAISYRTSAAVHYLIPLADGGDPLDPNNLVPTHKKGAYPLMARMGATISVSLSISR
jgi:HNH endonuclease